MTTGDATRPMHRSALGRLLDELSWVGPLIRNYRDGGVGYENVLLAEVMLALDFLPRTEFLGRVLASASGAPASRAQLIAEVEVAEFLLLPPETKLRPSGLPLQQLIVQPDASLVGPGTYALIEAKRLRGKPVFESEQLAREFSGGSLDQPGRRRDL